jgi:hypothetical protein
MPVSKHAVELGVLVGVGNLLIFQHFMPPVTDVKAGPQHDGLIEGSERTALLVSVAFTTLAAGFVKSWDTFLIAGAVIVGVDFAYKHANAMHPDTGKVALPAGAESLDMDNVHSLPMYEDVGAS